jgi:hypothetical protein
MLIGDMINRIITHQKYVNCGKTTTLYHSSLLLFLLFFLLSSYMRLYIFEVHSKFQGCFIKSWKMFIFQKKKNSEKKQALHINRYEMERFIVRMWILLISMSINVFNANCSTDFEWGSGDIEVERKRIISLLYNTNNMNTNICTRTHHTQ